MAVPYTYLTSTLHQLGQGGQVAYEFAKQQLGRSGALNLVKTLGPEVAVAYLGTKVPALAPQVPTILQRVRDYRSKYDFPHIESEATAGNTPRPSGAPIKTYTEPIPGVKSRTTDIVTSKSYHGPVNSGKIEDSYNTKNTTNNYYSTSTSTYMPRYYNPRRRYGRRIFRRRVRRIPYSRRRVSRRRFITVPRTMQSYGASAMRAIGQLKFLDQINEVNATVAATWTFQPIVDNIAQGTSMTQRIGNRVLLKKMIIRGFAQLANADPASLTDSIIWLKFVIVLDTQNNNTDNSTSMAAAGGMYINTDFSAFRNLYRVGRYRILHESIVQLTPDVFVNAAGTGVARTLGQKPIEVILPLNIIFEYNQSASTGAITTLPSNALYCGYVYSGGSQPLLDLDIRTRFKDLQ